MRNEGQGDAEDMAHRRLYIVRHARATGQEPDAPLTADGQQQAERLAELLAERGIDRIMSSPYRRAVATIAPLARRLGLPVATDARLVERVLSATPLPDWEDRLRVAFTDPDLRLPGGESGREAQGRARAVLDDVLRSPARTPLLVSHGNLITLLLQHFDPRFGFDAWRALTNPDVFVITMGEAPVVARIWQ
jgi:2,3-bisphosphoglycerate-dependent phosphoglycerate mutase